VTIRTDNVEVIEAKIVTSMKEVGMTIAESDGTDLPRRAYVTDKLPMVIVVVTTKTTRHVICLSIFFFHRDCYSGEEL
jgi:hypothetical protein